jgi:hypothetical protein
MKSLKLVNVVALQFFISYSDDNERETMLLFVLGVGIDPIGYRLL